MSPAKRKGGTEQPIPQLGIFWLVHGKLIVIGIPVTEGANYGESVTYAPSHYDKWHELQKRGAVPPECEYEEFPRGRVMFNRTTETFLLLADTCILGDKRMLTQVMQEMHLPKAATVMNTDSHYRCFRCLGLT